MTMIWNGKIGDESGCVGVCMYACMHACMHGHMYIISHSSQWSMTGVTKAVVYTILSMGWCI